MRRVAPLHAASFFAIWRESAQGQYLSRVEVPILTLSNDAARPWANASMDVLCRYRDRTGNAYAPIAPSSPAVGAAKCDPGRSIRQTLRTKLAILEQQLVKTPFFGGDRRDLADFMVACVLYVVRIRLKLDLTTYPKLDAWLTASINRPAAKMARKLREN
jgi:glutathione S-transferase